MQVTSPNKYNCNTLTTIVDVVTLCYQHHVIWHHVDSGVPQLPQTQPEYFE